MIDARHRRSHPSMHSLVKCCDALSILACALTVYWWIEEPAQWTDVPGGYLCMALGASVLMLCHSKVYRSWRVDEFRFMFGSLILAWLNIVFIIIFGFFVCETWHQLSRSWLVAWLALTIVFLLIQRVCLFAWFHWMQSLEFNSRSVLLVREADTDSSADQALAFAPWSGFKLRATLKPEALGRFVRDKNQTAPDEIWLCVRLEGKQSVTAALERLQKNTINLDL